MEITFHENFEDKTAELHYKDINKIYDTNEKVTSIVIPMLHEIKGMLIDMSAELNLNLDFGTLISNEENKE